MKKTVKKVISLFLTFAMLISYVMTAKTYIYAEMISDTEPTKTDEEPIVQYRNRYKIYEISEEELLEPWILYDSKSGYEHLHMRTTYADPSDPEDMSAMASVCVHSTEYVYKYYYRPYGGEIQYGTYYYGTEEEFKIDKDNDWIHWVTDGTLHYRYTYCTEINYYTNYYYYMWSEWTEWGETVNTPDEDTEVETREVYKIIYNTNGGEGGPENQVKIAGEDLTLSSTIPLRDEYVFLGWATSAESDVEYSVGGTYSADTHATLYAVWRHLNEFEAIKNYYRYREKTYTTSLEILDDPWILYDYEVEYEHTGFASVTKTSGYYGEGTLCIHDEIPVRKYVNQYNPNQYFYATYDEFIQMDATICLTYSATNDSYTRYVYCTSKEPYELYYYYSWSGWSEWYEGTIIAPAGADVETRPVALFTIIYDVNGGTEAPAPQTKTSAIDLTLSDAIPVRDDDVFLGWAESPDGEVLYHPGDVYSVNTSTTLYAQWDVRYTITFDANGGIGGPAAQLKIPGEKLTLSDSIPIREFYKFLGWSTNKEGPVEYLPNSGYFQEGNATLYAIWERDAEIVESGVCGDSLTWDLYNDGVLVIIGTGTMYNYDAYNKPWPSSDVKSVEISEGVINVGVYAFYGCSNISSIKLPDTMITIGSNAFNYCGTLTEITLPETLQYINERAFANCSSLREITIPDSVKQISEYAFEKCVNMTRIHLPSNLEYPYIHEGTFYHCSSLTEVTLPVNLQSIGYEAFRHCDSLCEITISKDLTRIGDEAFYGCVDLEKIFYEGTSEEWNAIKKGTDWDYKVGYSTSKGTYTLGKKEYTVSYNANDGEGAPASQTKIQGIELLLSTEIPTRTGYCFHGWATTPDGTVEFNAGDVFTQNTDVILYAVWREPYIYKIDYDANGGTGAPSPQIKTEDLALTLSVDIPTRTGYVFKHWEARKTLPVDTLESEHDYAYGTNQEWIVSSPGASSIELTFDDRTLFQKDYDFLYVYDSNGWRISTYTGMELAGETIKVQGDLIKLVLNTNYWNNYWGFAVTSAIAYYDTYNPGDSFLTNKDMTFYAVWEACTHKWDDGTVIVEPTHTSSGESLHLCTICGETRTEEVAKLSEHKYGLWIEYDPGRHAQTCECGDIVYADHRLNEGVITTQPTHTIAGVKTFTCVDCGATKTESIEKLSEHTYGNWENTNYGYHQKTCACGDVITENHRRDEGVVTRKPTHTSTGVMTYTCIVCGDKATLTIAKQPHVFTDWTKFSETHHTRSCECGTVETASHNWDDGVVTVEPIQSTYGERTYTCIDCSATKTEPIYTYMITYDANGGEAAPEPQFKEQDKALTLSNIKPIRTGYRFLYWSTNIDGELQRTLSVDGLESLHDYTDNTDQQWLISCPGAASITITFDSRTSFESNYDYLYIYDSEGNTVNKYTGRVLAGKTITVNGDTVTLHLTTDSMMTKWGFAVTSAHANMASYVPGANYTTDADVTLYAVWEVCYHNWDEGTITTQPTHTSFGECTYTCEDCSATKIEQVAKITEHSYGAWSKVDTENHQRTCVCGAIETETHNWDDGTITTQPTHTTIGERTYTCQDCFAIKTEQIAKTAEHSYEVVVIVPTCMEQGYTIYTCSCSDSYVSDYVDALGHDISEWKTVLAPTCTESGSESSTCTRCDYTETRTIDATGHSHTAVVTAPTCTEQGYTTYTCSCGHSYKDTYTPTTGHSYSYTVTDEPTISATGTLTGICSMCSDSTTVTLPKFNTTDYTYTVTNEPTCTGTGIGRYTWKTTNYGSFHFEVSIAPKGHSYTTMVTAPTCTEQGYTTYICSCSDSYVSDYVVALGHDMGDWKLATAPTCIENGSESSTCTRCDYTETRAIDAIGHSHTAIVTAPTCTEQGFTTYTCSCGDTYVSDEIPALGHTEETIPAVAATCIETGLTEGKKCSVCGEILVAQEVVPALGHDWKGTSCQRCDANRENPFDDVADGSFYIDPVLWAVENGITNGATATTFNPNGTCLRAHVVTFLHRAAGNPAPDSNKNPFTDVKSSDFFYQPVLWAVEKGITNGTTATTFGSYANCNRAAVVTFLWRAAGEPEPESTNNPFVDIKTTDFFYKPVLWAVEQGITNGVDATHFGPATDCNRAQVVTFLYRAYN